MRSILLALWLVVSLLVGTAAAVPVSITGGFTYFDGPVGGTNVAGITQTVNGVPVCSQAGCAEPSNAHLDFATVDGDVPFQLFINSVADTANRISFTPAGVQEVIGTGPSNKFLLGSLSYTNGNWFPPEASFGFTVTTSSV